MAEKSSSVNKIFGIDLGTTYSSIAYINKYGVPEILPNAEGHRATPSVIYFEGGKVIVGQEAVKRAAQNPDDVVSFVKRSMGEPDFQYVHGDKSFSAEEISSFILRKLVSDAEKHLGEKISDVVITCPAYFGINEREATKVSGEIAGLNVRQIINEPTAAAIAYGSAEMDKEHVVLVYDLGGGTFDITMIDIRPDSIEVIGTGGDHNLGGKDWDDRILVFVAEEIYKQTGKDVLDDVDTWSSLQFQAEKAKKELGDHQKSTISVKVDGKDIRVDITRAGFDDMTKDLLERTVSLTKEMLAEARKKDIKYRDFDEIILVGGSTRMPQVGRGLHQKLGMEPRLFHPEEAIAKGAAIFGWKILLKDQMVERIIASKKSSGKDLNLEQLEFLSDNFEKAARVAAAQKGADWDDEGGSMDLDSLSEGSELSLELDTDHIKKSEKRAAARQKLANEQMDIDLDLSFEDFEEAAKAVANATGYATKAIKKEMVTIRDVASKSFGIVVKNAKGEEGVSMLVLRNTTVPVKLKKTFHTLVPNQKRIHVRIMECDTSKDWVSAMNANEIGDAFMELPSGLPKKTLVDVQFSLNREGRLDLRVTERKEGRNVEFAIKTTGVISGDALEQAKARRTDFEVS